MEFVFDTGRQFVNNYSIYGDYLHLLCSMGNKYWGYLDKTYNFMDKVTIEIKFVVFREYEMNGQLIATNKFVLVSKHIVSLL